MTRDPLTILHSANPFTEEELAEPLTSTGIRDLYQQVIDAPPSPLPVPARRLPRRASPRRRWLAAALLVTLAASAGWAVSQASRQRLIPAPPRR